MQFLTIALFLFAASTAKGFVNGAERFSANALLKQTAQDTSQVSTKTTAEQPNTEMAKIAGSMSLPIADQAMGIVVLTQEDFNQGNIVNVWQLIEGRVPGLFIGHTGGAPGGNTSVFSRTYMEPTENIMPLIIVDGLPIKNFSATDRNPLNWLSPADIESVAILKNGAARSLYGMNGGNGVIIITTRKASRNQEISFSYSSNLSFLSPAKTFDVLDAASFRQLVSTRYANNTGALNLLGSATTNWQNEIFRNTLAHNHQLSAAGSVYSIPWRVSLNLSDQNGILDTDQMKRLGSQLSIAPSLFDDHLKISLVANFSKLNDRLAPHNAIFHAVGFDPTQPVKDPGSPFGGFFTYTNSGYPSPLSVNPVARLQLTDNQNQIVSQRWNAQLSYRLHFLPELSINLVNYSEKVMAERNLLVPEYASWVYLMGGRQEKRQDTLSNTFFETWLNYQKNIPGTESQLEIMAGYSRQKISNSYNMVASSIIIEPPGFFQSQIGMSEEQMLSRFARLGFSYKEKYLINYNVRNDTYSLFSEVNRSASYHSVAAAWLIHNESFWSKDFFINETKLRFSYGSSGIKPSLQGMYDPNIKPAVSNMLNTGFDFALLNRRISGSFELFQNKTENMAILNFLPMGGFFISSEGSMEHKGWEFSLNTIPVNIPDFSWQLGGHIAQLKNKIIKMYNAGPNFNGSTWGSIAGGIGNDIFIYTNGHPSASFFVYQNIYDQNGNPIPGIFADQNGDGFIDERDKIRKETPSPDFLLGINSMVQWKNWSLGFSGRASLGNYVYNNTSSSFGFYRQLYRPEGPFLGNITTEALELNFDFPYYLSDYYVQNASFFRMDYLNLGYHFWEVFGGFSLTLSANVQNVFVITPYKGIDPEVPSGIDMAAYPRPRIFSLGVSLGF